MDPRGHLRQRLPLVGVRQPGRRHRPRRRRERPGRHDRLDRRRPAHHQPTDHPTTRSTAISYGRTITVDLPYDDAVAKVKETFRAHGFGTLTEIDVRATLKDKLDEDMEDYVILGVCNPRLAHRALGIDRSIGLLLPCTVVVRATGDGTVVEALDPQVMVDVPGQEDLRPIADQAREKINAALDDLTG